VGVEIDDDAVPVAEPVRGACEMLGLDPMHVANEGILVAFVPPEQADAALAALRSLPEGAASAVVGRALAEHPGRVVVRTMVGARRVLDVLVGEQLPRIC
jgi:hydrogenase expression/formation protein HypE